MLSFFDIFCLIIFENSAFEMSNTCHLCSVRVIFSLRNTILQFRRFSKNIGQNKFKVIEKNSSTLSTIKFAPDFLGCRIFVHPPNQNFEVLIKKSAWFLIRRRFIVNLKLKIGNSQGKTETGKWSYSAIFGAHRFIEIFFYGGNYLSWKVCWPKE